MSQAATQEVTYKAKGIQRHVIYWGASTDKAAFFRYDRSGGAVSKTVKAWRNLWFHSGDRVVRDADGHYRFIDRMKDSIRRRGENVSSWEVEQTIQSHPAVAACAIYPLPSELGEDEVAAAILLEPGQSLEPVDIVRHCEGQIAYFAIPRYVRILGQMPLTENGKIKKGVLREAGITTDTWDREAAGLKVRR